MTNFGFSDTKLLGKIIFQTGDMRILFSRTDYMRSHSTALPHPPKKLRNEGNQSVVFTALLAQTAISSNSVQSQLNQVLNFITSIF